MAEITVKVIVVGRDELNATQVENALRHSGILGADIKVETISSETARDPQVEKPNLPKKVETGAPVKAKSSSTMES